MSTPTVKNEHHKTKPEDRVPLGRKLAFGVGGIPQALMSTAINQLANPVFNIALGVNPVLLGVALSIPRFWDAITDPLMGNFSDNLRTRWGRRRPVIFCGAILTGLVYMLMWNLPHGWSEMAYFWYFLIVSLIYYLAFTTFSVPFYALGYEMSPDYHEKTRVISFQNAFIAIGGLLQPWLFYFVTRGCFSDMVVGARVIAIPIGLMFMAIGVIPAIFCRERHQVSAVKKTDKTPIFKAMGQALCCRPFRLLALTALVMGTGVMMVNSLGPYVNIYYVFGGDLKRAAVMQGFGGMGFFISMFISTPAIVWLSSRISKKKALVCVMSLVVIGAASKWWTYTPDIPWLWIVSGMVMAPGFSGVNVLIQSMIADVCDLDELQTGKRKEGIYASVYSWVVKTGMSTSYFIANVILAATGFNAALGAEQAPRTLVLMRALLAFIPVAALLIAITLISLYSVSEQQAYEIREQLDRRKAERHEDD